MTRLRVHRRAALALVVFLWSAGASAQGRGGEPDVVQRMVRLVQEERFEEARTLVVNAIQREPLRRELYLGHARILLAMQAFEEASFAYELYLRHPALLAQAGGQAQPSPRVLEEVRRARAGRQAPDAPLRLPDAQEAAFEAIQGLVRRGPVVAGRPGDVVTMYATLLRAGFAHPDLHALRGQIVEALVREIDAVWSCSDAAVPVGEEAFWRVHRERYDHLEALSATLGGQRLPTPQIAPTLGRSLVDGQLALWNQDGERAATAFGEALRVDARCIPAQLGRLNALHAMGPAGRPRAREALVGLRAALAHHRVPDTVSAVYEVVFAPDDGQRVRAAEALLERWRP